MTRMVVTVEVSQLPIGWLKPLLEWNMWYMVVTVDVSQLPIGWLKTLLEWNGLHMVFAHNRTNCSNSRQLGAPKRSR